MSSEHVRKIRNALHRLEWAATRKGSVPLEDVRAERRIVEDQLDALEGILEEPPAKLCPGSAEGNEHAFTSDIGGHCRICGYGHQ